MVVLRFARVSVAIPSLNRNLIRSFSSAAAFDLDFRDGRVKAYMANIDRFLENLKNSGSGGITRNNLNRLRTLSSIYGKAGSVLKEIDNLEQLRSEMAASDEREMADIAKSDIDNCLLKLKDISDEALQYIIPHELQDTDEIMMEFSAGVGGQEAMLFTADLFEMYANHARINSWSLQVLEFSGSEAGGLRKGSLLLGGINVGRRMKFESGVHRVQRTPKTERSGRIHTSTATVAVLPCPVEVDVVIDPKDLLMKFKRAGGPGGQHVNKTESAVQILHVPSGIQVEADIERSQSMNKEAAMKKLRTKLYELEIKKETSKVHSERRLQVGTAGRSEKVRTYNFAQDRITDHRIGVSVHNLPECLAGGKPLSKLIDALHDAHRKELAEHLIANQLYQ